MKKTFQLTHPKIKYPRMVDAVRSDVKKYIKRERRKELPEGIDYWDFDCKFGDTEETATAVHLDDISAKITDAEGRELTSFYVEILVKTAKRKPRVKPERKLDPEAALEIEAEEE